MTDAIVTKKVLSSTGTVGWAMMGLGNAMLIFFLITLGIDNEMVLADLIWCLVLDTGAIVLYVTCDDRFKKVKTNVS